MLATTEVEEGEGSEQPTEPQPTPSHTQPSVGDQPHVTDSSNGPDNTHSPNINLKGTGRKKGDLVQLSNDSPHSGGNTSKRAEGELNIEELLSLFTNLSNRVLALETSEDAQSMVKECEKVIHEEKVGKEGASHGMDYMDTEEAVNEERKNKETDEINVTHDTEVLDKGGSNEEPVNAADIGVSTAVSTVNISTASRPEVSTATPKTPPTTISVFEDEDIFLADALVMLSDKAKLKGVEIKEKKDAERHPRSVLTLKPLPKINPKDKGKGVLGEEPEPVKVKSKDQSEAQIEKDVEIALKTQEEQEKYTVDERAKLLAEYFENRKKQLAKERAAAIRNKPPIRSQLRSLMMTYLKHTCRYKHAQLNKKTLEEIQVLYIKEQERATNFVPIRSEEYERLIQKMNTKVAGVHEEKAEDLRWKQQRSLECKKTDSDFEEEEHLKTFLKRVPDEEGIIDYEVLKKIFPIIN
ncbi:hypothetical protein Tco_1022286 [Tanacetum coccineum]